VRFGTSGVVSQPAAQEAVGLIPGTIVEIVGHDGGLMASTPFVRVRLESASLSARFGDPALFATDEHTVIEPSAPTIAATGVRVGARVQVEFDGRGAKTASGAYLLTRFVVVSSGALPDCLVALDIARYPQGDTARNGGATPEAALRSANPTITNVSLFPMGMGTDSKAPVWIVAGTDTFVATSLPDGTWFVSPAKFLRCRDPLELRSTQPSGTSPSAVGAVPPSPQHPSGPIPPAQVAAGMPAGAAIFAQTAPTCGLDADGKTYRCTLATAPTPEVSDFLGSKEMLVIDGIVAGGCVGLDHAGMTWSCFIGQEAVDRNIIGKDLLGQPAPFPGRG
jgi:hypothetical protein